MPAGSGILPVTRRDTGLPERRGQAQKMDAHGHPRRAMRVRDRWVGQRGGRRLMVLVELDRIVSVDGIIIERQNPVFLFTIHNESGYSQPYKYS